MNINLSTDTANYDELYKEAVKFIAESRKASISVLQCQLNIDYKLATVFIKMMEDTGVISEADSSGARFVLAPPPISNSEHDELYDEAVRFVTESNKSSIADVQRHLKIGYNRAAVLIESMQEAGVLDDTGSLQEK